jgi:transcription initiation factor TFIIIB Brf1 subunit/transcription initiation factor TFIIB
VASECSECHSEIRYDLHGFKACVKCGLIREEIVLPETFTPSKHAHNTRSQAYLGWDAGMEDETPPDERYSTFDRYYAQAYAKRRK